MPDVQRIRAHGDARGEHLQREARCRKALDGPHGWGERLPPARSHRDGLRLQTAHAGAQQRMCMRDSERIVPLRADSQRSACVTPILVSFSATDVHADGFGAVL